MRDEMLELRKALDDLNNMSRNEGAMLVTQCLIFLFDYLLASEIKDTMFAQIREAMKKVKEGQ